MIEVENIVKAFQGRRVLDGVSFQLKPGELVGLVGPSGGGKSVLMKILGGIIPPDSGLIRAEDSSELNVGFLFQEGALFDSITVLENVMFPIVVPKDRSFFGERRTAGQRENLVARRKAQQLAFEILDEVGLVQASEKLPGQLSGGMRRRVGLARALVARPQLVLLDDPTGGLDPVAASVIIDLIHRLHEHFSPTIVLASHDIRRLLPNVQRVIGLFGGRVLCDVAPRSLAGAACPEVVEFLSTRFDFSEFASAQ